MKQQEIEWRPPLEAFAPLARREGAVLLHGGALASDADWSFIAAEPARRIETRLGATLLDGRPIDASPFEALKALHGERRSDTGLDNEVPLASGLAGFAGYECARFIEPGADGPSSPYALPDFSFGAYDAVAAFNRSEQRVFIFGRSRKAIDSLEALLGKDGQAASALSGDFVLSPSNMSQAGYAAKVASVIERIAEGEVFQANISQRLAATAIKQFDPYTLFCAASAHSSAQFGAYLHFHEGDLLSLSPERFFHVSRGADGKLSIRAEPIKGTRPRGRTPEEDARLLAELKADAKERAENVMIADLTRNDLSKICEDHSIVEEAICEAVSHATVHHLVSRIAGKLQDGLTAADALASLFPCGSVTGAPKVQAMKVIADVEKTGRGPYCGAIGYIDDRGGADFSVAIRIAVAEGTRIAIPVGGGVTLRSDPQAEYEETLHKARQLLRLLRVEAAA